MPTVPKKIEVILLTEREREREREISQLRSRIAELETITNRTTEQERELQEKKRELAKLGKESSSGEKGSQKPTNYTPWIIGGSIVGGVLVIAIIVYLLRSRKPRKKLVK